MSLHSKRKLAKRLRANKAFRDAFVSSRVSQTLALQLRVLRQREGLSQVDLARELGTSQNAIYRMENPDYGRHSISVLKKVAAYFDVGLVVRFATHSEILDWVVGMDSESIDVPTADNDVRLKNAADSTEIDEKESTDGTSTRKPFLIYSRDLDVPQIPEIEPMVASRKMAQSETNETSVSALTM